MDSDELLKRATAVQWLSGKPGFSSRVVQVTSTGSLTHGEVSAQQFRACGHSAF